MNVYVLNRRSIIFKTPGNGTVDVVFVPGRDQIQIVRNIAGMADVAVTEKGVKSKLPQLARLRLGMRYIYGHLIEEITELSQPVRVWLAEDFVEPDSKAFFFVFSPTVIIHGIRESNDEGQIHWRTARLPIQGDAYADLLNAISDYVIANSTEGLIVAVHNQVELYKKLQEDLAPYSIYPVPFSKLKPGAEVKPLYRHFDFTIFYATMLLFGMMALVTSLGYLAYTILKRNRLEDQIESVQTEIKQIQLNQNISQVKDPQAVLGAMIQAGDVPPSAIIQGVGEAVQPLGDLDSITFQPIVLKKGEPTPATETVTVNLNNLKDELLVDQEKTAKAVLNTRPWVRSIQRVGSTGKTGQFDIELQTGKISTEAEPEPMPTPSEATPPQGVSATPTVVPPAQAWGPSSTAVAPQAPAPMVSATTAGALVSPSSPRLANSVKVSLGGKDSK